MREALDETDSRSVKPKLTLAIQSRLKGMAVGQMTTLDNVSHGGLQGMDGGLLVFGSWVDGACTKDGSQAIIA